METYRIKIKSSAYKLNFDRRKTLKNKQKRKKGKRRREENVEKREEKEEMGI